MMTENACKSLRFNTMSAITTRFGRKRRTLECGLHDDYKGICDLLARHHDQGSHRYISNSRLVLKSNQCTNGFCLQIKIENVRIKVSV